MIEATQAVKKQSLPPEPAAKPPQKAEQEDRDTPAASTSTPEVQVAERQRHVPPSSPSFDVRLDGATMRLYSELRDPETDRVLLRLPAGYRPEEEETTRPHVSTEA